MDSVSCEEVDILEGVLQQDNQMTMTLGKLPGVIRVIPTVNQRKA
jgi:hypothetical protein